MDFLQNSFAKHFFFVFETGSKHQQISTIGLAFDRAKKCCEDVQD